MTAFRSLLLCLCLTGCNGLLYEPSQHPFSIIPTISSTGSHAGTGPSKSKYTVVVLSQFPVATTTLSSILIQAGHTIVERAQVEAVFDEQVFQLTHSPDESSLRVGRMLGADLVAIIDVWPASVSVRAVIVESGAILWAGTAMLSAVVTQDWQVAQLTKEAVRRAMP